ncbi:MAG: hypothetical protein KA120_08825 [Candidatus Goldbacteria bacterium]|nr:hypothetical protein [Candidatus Goldiibacteriota bacterium]HPD19609.1 hypothetical protein [Candidatus Goldiibacteriota bacterium]
MGRRKGKERKDRQLLIRVSEEEYELAKRTAKENEITMSEFFRRSMWNYKNKKNKTDINKIIAKKYEEVLEKFRKLYEEYNR